MLETYLHRAPYFSHSLKSLIYLVYLGGRVENPQRHRTMKARQVECRGHLLEFYREAILVTEGEMNREVNLKVDLAEEQTVEDVEKGKKIIPTKI